MEERAAEGAQSREEGAGQHVGARIMESLGVTSD